MYRIRWWRDVLDEMHGQSAGCAVLVTAGAQPLSPPETGTAVDLARVIHGAPGVLRISLPPSGTCQLYLRLTHPRGCCALLSRNIHYSRSRDKTSAYSHTFKDFPTTMNNQGQAPVGQKDDYGDKSTLITSTETPALRMLIHANSCRIHQQENRRPR